MDWRLERGDRRKRGQLSTGLATVLVRMTKIWTSALPVRMDRRAPGDRSTMTISQVLHRFLPHPEFPKFQKLQRPTEFMITLPSMQMDSLFLFLGPRFSISLPFGPGQCFHDSKLPPAGDWEFTTAAEPLLWFSPPATYLCALNQDDTFLLKCRDSVPGIWVA